MQRSHRWSYSSAIAVLLAVVLSACNSGAEQPPIAFTDAPLIDPNAATESELNGVPGMTADAVAAILANRPFATQSELHAAIGSQLTDQRATYQAMFIRVDLNNGAEDDYKLIPSSLSPGKLAHEFEEYRPYEDLTQFEREMSKYVSDEEVAHLARYVTLD